MGLHISELGIKIIIYDDVITKCLYKGYQYGLSENFVNCFRTDEKKSSLIMEILLLITCGRLE